MAGRSPREDAEPRSVRARIRQLEPELEIVKRASKWLAEEESVDQKGGTRYRPSRRYRGIPRDLLHTLRCLQAG